MARRPGPAGPGLVLDTQNGADALGTHTRGFPARTGGGWEVGGGADGRQEGDEGRGAWPWPRGYNVPTPMPIIVLAFVADLFSTTTTPPPSTAQDHPRAPQEYA